jgi:hypothetical protein
VEAEFRGKISHWARTKNAGVAGSPGAVRFQIFPQTAVGVVDAAVQCQLCGPALEFGEGKIGEQCNWIVIDLFPAQRVEIEENAGRIVIPTPPKIARQ